MDKITIKKDNLPIYDICFTDSFKYLSDVIKNLGIGNRRVCIITDSNVEKYHLNNLLTSLKDACDRIYSFTFEAGEQNKNLSTIEDMYAYLIENHFDRNDVLFALGGGVVGDMTGFLAATYLRGIKFVQVPTSLLAMVDSSIGGKTGVDFCGYKNMIGAFHMPSYVYINTSVLDTLPEREFISGFAEIIKHAFIKDRKYYDYLANNYEAALCKDKDILKNIIYRSCQIKQSIVEEDPTEKSIRAFLNFGHTIGHAIEKYMNFTMLHGECVSLGCIASLYICKERNLIDDTTYNEAYNLLNNYKLPVSIDVLDEETVNCIIDITKSDKKADNNSIKFVLIKCIGQAFIDMTVSDEEMRIAVKELFGGNNV